MRNGWKKVNLSDLYDITSSKRVFKSDWVSEGVPFYRAREIVKIEKEGSVNNELFITSEMYEKYKDKYGVPVCGDVLITAVGTLGVCYNVKKNDKFYFKDGNVIWLKQKNNQIDSFFLKYQFKTKSVLEHVNAHKGAVVGTYTIEKAKATKIILPPLEEQQKIVEKLDKAFELIDQAKANIEQNIINAKELFQSKLDEVFSQKGDGWMDSRLQDICEKITDGTHQTPTYFESGYVFLSSKNVTTGKIDWDNVKYIDEVQHNAMYRRVAPKMGDILLAKNGTTGIAAIVDRDVIFDIYVSLAWIRSKGDVLPEYLLRYINSPLAKTQFNSRLKGIGVPNLHLKEIREVVIRYPINKIEQEKYADYIQSLDDEINRLVSMYNVKLSNLEELRKSILEKAFKGELTH